MEALHALLITAAEDAAISDGSSWFPVSRGETRVIPAPKDGGAFFTVWGIGEREGSIPVPTLHSIVFKDGAPVSATLPVVDWGGVAQVEVKPAYLPSRGYEIPKLLDTLDLGSRNSRAKAELYRDGVLRLNISGQGEAVTLAVGEGESGSLGLLDVGSARLVYVHVAKREGERLIMLGPDTETLLDIEGDKATVIDGRPTCIKALGTVRGHERRLMYEYANGSFGRPREEIGFFTRERREPRSDGERALALVEEAGMGLGEEWRSFLTPDLSKELGSEELRSFIGEFAAAKLCPLSADVPVVGVMGSGGMIMRPRMFSFVFEDGLIEDVRER
ncbi:MAG: hypothetical protein J5586_02710 [Clostridia bacterium]|nr:hypothetical protein [Clostridia bacterium]